MKAVCIGGPRDGEVIEVEDGRTSFQAITDNSPVARGHRPVTMTYRLVRYVAGAKEFLAFTPSHQSPESTMEMLLFKYANRTAK